jgi:hypothetical protein
MQFTPERQLLLEKMAVFFDETVRENFPAEVDTLSYEKFLRCIIHNGCPSDFQFIQKIDREKLSEINTVLFQDENYYFFFSGDWSLPENDTVSNPDHRRRIRYRGEFCHFFPKNPGSPEPNDGYMRYTLKQYADNPLFREINDHIKISGEFGTVLFMTIVLNLHLCELSKLTVKQFTSVVLWSYLCYCGGVDLPRRKKLSKTVTNSCYASCKFFNCSNLFQASFKAAKYSFDLSAK